MKYIEILEDLKKSNINEQFHKFKLGKVYQIGINITSGEAGGLVHAKKAKFVDAPIIPPKEKAVKAKKKEKPESDSELNDEGN